SSSDMHTPTFVDLQGFVVNGRFVVKEVAVLKHETVLTHYIFTNPVPWKFLTRSDKSCASWLTLSLTDMDAVDTTRCGHHATNCALQNVFKIYKLETWKGLYEQRWNIYKLLRNEYKDNFITIGPLQSTRITTLRSYD
ncbi:hypothetical protein ALC62_03218, partial [Cyphomyrmex costatus]